MVRLRMYRYFSELVDEYNSLQEAAQHAVGALYSDSAYPIDIIDSTTGKVLWANLDMPSGESLRELEKLADGL